MTHEVRLASNPESKLIWQVGAMHYDNQLENAGTVLIATPIGQQEAFTDAVKKKTTAFGVFAQATYPVTDTSRVTAGLRYDKTEVTQTEIQSQGPALPSYVPGAPPFVLSGDAGKRDFSNLTYKLRLEHDLTAANLLYASVSTGFSPGDVTVAPECPPSFSSTSPCAIELEAETLRSYEIGSKNRFLDDTLQLNASLFYSKYGAFQSAGINVNPNGFPPLFAPLAVPLESYGLEFESLYKFTPMDLLGMNVGWTKAHYGEKSALFAQYVAQDDVTANDAPGSPAPIPVSASLSYEHTFMLSGDSTLVLRGQALYSSRHGGNVTRTEFNAGQQPLVDIDSAVLGNLSATWTANKHLAVTGYVRNVTDHQYFTRINVGAAAAPATGFVYVHNLNDPRTYGLVLNVSF